MLTTSRDLAAALVDLVLPRTCAGCGAAGTTLCRGCADPRRASPVRVATAGALGPVTAAGRYEDGLRRAVLAYKERGRRDLAGPLGGLLAAALELLVAGVDPARLLLVPVASSRAAAARRGGDHVARLARAAGRRTGVPVGPGLLVLGRAVADSAGLGLDARARNLAGAMRARMPARGCRVPVIIVDDVVTSGATLAEANRALRAAGWPVAGAAVVAATPRRHPPAGAAPECTSDRAGEPAGVSGRRLLGSDRTRV